MASTRLRVPLVAIAWLVHASLIAGVGLWMSNVSRTTLRATICTLLAAAALNLGPLLLSNLFDDFRLRTLDVCILRGPILHFWY